MSKFNELVERVIKWSEGIDLYNQSTASHQKAKAFEELGELLVAIENRDRLEIADAIGDILVCIVNANHLTSKGMSNVYEVNSTIETSVENMSGLVAYSICADYQSAVESLSAIASMFHLDMNKCFEMAVETIEKRKLLMVNGKAVKWENMTEEQQFIWRSRNES